MFCTSSLPFFVALDLEIMTLQAILSSSRWPVNKQNGLRAEWVQEQKIFLKYINFYKLIGKKIYQKCQW